MSAPADPNDVVQEMRTSAAHVRAALAAIRGRGTAGDRAVTAVVDSSGHLVDLALTPKAYTLGDRLPAMILTATRAAEADASAQVARAMRPLTEDTRIESAVSNFSAMFGPDLAAETANDGSQSGRVATVENTDRDRRGGWMTSN